MPLTCNIFLWPGLSRVERRDDQQQTRDLWHEGHSQRSIGVLTLPKIIFEICRLLMRDPSHPMIKPTKDILAHVFNSRRPPAKLHRPILYEIPTDLHGLTDQQTIDERKGYLFEQFVVTLFDREYFTLLEWRSDKCIWRHFSINVPVSWPGVLLPFTERVFALRSRVQMASIFYQWNCRVVERNAIGESQTVWENHTNSCFYSVGNWWLSK